MSSSNWSSGPSSSSTRPASSSSSVNSSPYRNTDPLHSHTNPLYVPSAQPALSSSPAQPTTSSLKSSTISQRLYVGNLHPAVSEYDLVQLFTPFGKIAKLDLLFHRAGPFKGRPRGYGFVEYVKEEDAVLAKVEMEGKEVKGRKLTVSFANKSEYAEQSTTGPIRRSRRDDDLKPTTLSLVKTSQLPQGTNAKIAAMEARLQAMKSSKGKGSGGVEDDHDEQIDSSTSRERNGNQSSLKIAPPAAGLPRRPGTQR